MSLFSGIAILVAIIDQLIKFYVEKNISEKSIDIIENIFSFSYLKNYGAAWGIFSENSWILTIITPMLIIFITYYLYKYKNGKGDLIIGAIVVGGAIGNYIDRIFRGYVVDYIDFKIWPVFNFADVCIVVGCVLFTVSLLRTEKL